MADRYRMICPSCRATWARDDFCCVGCHLEVRRPHAWDFADAYKLAKHRLVAAGATRDELAALDGAPVTRARKMAEMAAPALMRLQLALTLGTSPEELDRVRGGARLLLEACKQTLAVVGLRAGEEVSVDLSERMQGFLERWQSAPALPEHADPLVLDVDPGEPARRVR